MPSNDNINFLKNGMYDRVVALCGGNPNRVAVWWTTPIATPPFNLRTPQDLMNVGEWKLVYNWLINAVAGDYISDIDFKQQAEKFGFINDQVVVQDTLDKPYGYGGTETKIQYYNTSAQVNAIPVYRVHTFTSSATFVMEQAGTIEYLLVGGGGGGGDSDSTIPGGGGGGGGVLMGTMKLQRGQYPIVVGAGGTAGYDRGLTRSSGNGGNSTFLNMIAYGGGAGAFRSTAILDGSPLAGGSGGGGCPPESSVTGSGIDRNQNRQYGALGVNGQGYAGGNASSTYTDLTAGGGGGAGGPGGNGSFDKAGDGGPGVMSEITGTKTYYGGGGAGGAGNGSGSPRGGSGGIGGGASTPNYINYLNTASTGPAAAASSTGGGGGGGHYGNYGSAGGSGIVVIRYRV